MADTFPHLTLQRETPVNDKRPGGSPRSKTLDDPIAHGVSLHECLTNATVETETDEGGFDDRRLFRFTVDEGFSPDDLSKTKVSSYQFSVGSTVPHAAGV